MASFIEALRDRKLQDIRQEHIVKTNTTALTPYNISLIKNKGIIMNVIMEKISVVMKYIGMFINVIFFLYCAAILFIGFIKLIDALSSSPINDYHANRAIADGVSYALIWIALYGMRKATMIASK